MIKKYNRLSLIFGVPGFFLQGFLFIWGQEVWGLLGVLLFMLGVSFHARSLGRTAWWGLIGCLSWFSLMVLIFLKDKSSPSKPPAKKVFFLIGLAFLPAVFLFSTSGFGLSVSTDEEPTPSYFGIQGGYFTCVAPEGWQSQAKDMPDYMTSELLFLGPKVENVPVTISVFYYADGNPSFKDLEAFVGQEIPQVPATLKTKIQGREVVVFEKEHREYLLSSDPAADDTVLLKKKYHVFSGKDPKGFFVIQYTAPQSAYEAHLPVFESVAESFKFV